jgi:GTPase Era involved in 16S rRNA processing
LMNDKELEKLRKKLQKSLKGQEILSISSVAQVGLEELNDHIWAALQG